MVAMPPERGISFGFKGTLNAFAALAVADMLRIILHFWRPKNPGLLQTSKVCLENMIVFSGDICGSFRGNVWKLVYILLSVDPAEHA